MSEPENKLLRILMYFMSFLVRALPQVQNQIRKEFSDKVLYNLCSIFLWSVLSKKMAFQKNGFSIVFSKSYLNGGETVFFAKNVI